VSRGGRPDLAFRFLAQVTSPTLLIVGGEDTQVMAMNKSADVQLKCENAFEVAPGATHLFEEPGTLDEVVRSASEWFRRHLDRRRDDPAPTVRL
jgi:putative phosphoribosyl transferase